MINFYNKYIEIKNEHQQAYNNIFKFFVIAFNNKDTQTQYEEAIKKYHLEGQKLYYLGLGGYTTAEGLQQMKAADERLKERIKNEVINDNEQFIAAIRYEMNNTEFYYIEDLNEIFSNFYLTPEEVENDPRLNDCYLKARKQYIDAVLDNMLKPYNREEDDDNDEEAEQ